MLFCLKSFLDRDDQLWEDWKDLVFAKLNKLVKTHVCQELIRILSLSQTMEENW